MLTVLIGVALQFGGYYGMYMAAVGRFDVPYFVMILLAFAACNGQTWYETAGLVTSVRNFETERWAPRSFCFLDALCSGNAIQILHSYLRFHSEIVQQQPPANDHHTAAVILEKQTPA